MARRKNAAPDSGPPQRPVSITRTSRNASGSRPAATEKEHAAPAEPSRRSRRLNKDDTAEPEVLAVPPRIKPKPRPMGKGSHKTAVRGAEVPELELRRASHDAPEQAAEGIAEGPGHVAEPEHVAGEPEHVAEEPEHVAEGAQEPGQLLQEVAQPQEHVADVPPSGEVVEPQDKIVERLLEHRSASLANVDSTSHNLPPGVDYSPPRTSHNPELHAPPHPPELPHPPPSPKQTTARGIPKRRAAPTTSLFEHGEDRADQESGTSGLDYFKDDTNYKVQRSKRHNNGTWAPSDELDEEEDIDLEDDVVTSEEDAGGKKKRRVARKGQKKRATTGGTPVVDDEAADGDVSDSEDENEDTGGQATRKKGRLPKKVKAEATALWEKFLEDIDEIATRTGHARHTLLLASGAALKKHRKLNAWNAFHAVHSIDNPRPVDMDRSIWLTEHVKPVYDALFKDCDDSAAGKKKRAKIQKELIEKKTELDAQINKKYAESGKKYRIMQKVAQEMEEQAQYAHNVSGVEVFGLVYEGGYGDINATAANTMFAGSSEMAAVLADKKVAGKQLIGEIQALVGVKIRQDVTKNKIRDHDGPGNRDEWRHEVQQRFHAQMFPDAEGRRRVHWTKMGWWLFTNEKRLLRWPSLLPIPNSKFDLNKLNIEQLKLLCKAKVEVEDWTQNEKEAPRSDQADIILISSGSGSTLLTLGEVDEWRAKNAKSNKRAAAKKKSLMPSVVVGSDDDMNARIDTNHRFVSPARATAHPPSPSAAAPSVRNSPRSASPERSTRRSLSPPRRSPSRPLTPPPHFSKGKRKALSGDDMEGMVPGPLKRARADNGNPPQDAPDVQAASPTIVEVPVDGKMCRFMYIGGKMVPIAE